MNLYLLLEGKSTERKVYRAWFKFLFPHLAEVNRPEDLRGSNYFLHSAQGYPDILNLTTEVLEYLAIQDQVDHLLICLDTEEQAPEVVRNQVTDILEKGPHFPNTHIVLQNCCIETWFLGNPGMMPVVIENEPLQNYSAFYDVSKQDPEAMPAMPPDLIRAQFHFKYLRELARANGLSYTKKRPHKVLKQAYYLTLVERQNKTGHLASFGAWVDLSLKLGAALPG